MSIAEIKASIHGMTGQERLVIAAGLQHCARESDPANQTLLSERRMRGDNVLEPTLDQAGRIPLSVSENYLSPFAAEVRRRISGQVYLLVRLLTSAATVFQARSQPLEADGS